MGLQGLNFQKKRSFALTGDNQTSLLAEVIKISTGTPSLRVLAQVEGSLQDEVTLPRLLAATTESLRGEISIALPLNFFEIVTVTLPIMAEEAIGKALPYHLAKLIDKPLPEFLYDWQITQRQRDNLQITVYLYPVASFNKFRKEFAREQLEITHMEADVFAAFAYLDRVGQLPAGEVTLCALIWPDNISLAVYENTILRLVRTVAADRPTTAYTSLPEPTAAPLDILQEATPAIDPGPVLKLELETDVSEHQIEMPQEDGSAEEDPSSILASFDVFGVNEIKPEMAEKSKGQLPPEPAPSPLHETVEATWPDYVQNITLEIMRTRDYYATVLKGGTIKNFIVGGGDIFWEDLQSLAGKSLEICISPLASTSIAPNSPPALNAICLGTGTR